MGVKTGALELDLIKTLGHAVARELTHESPAAYREFVRQYYHWVPATDLADRDPATLPPARCARTASAGS